MVLGEGLEPSRLTAPEPKSGVSANFTTRAFGWFVIDRSGFVVNAGAHCLLLLGAGGDHQLLRATRRVS